MENKTILGEKDAIEPINSETININEKGALFDAIKQLDISVKSFNWKKLEDYISLGYILYKLKILYVKKCTKCLDNDESDFMTCKRCISLSDSKGFFADVKKIVDYSKYSGCCT